MKILYCLNSATPGGMEKHVLDLVHGMIGRGHEVFVWCPKGTVSDWFKGAGAEIIYAQVGFELDPVYIYKLAKFLSTRKIDVVHAHELKAAANALVAGILAGTSVRISHVHTPISEWRIPNWIKDLFTRLTIFGYSSEVNFLATREIALTESRKRVKMAEGIKESTLEIIPNGVDIGAFATSESEKANFKREMLTKYNIPTDAFIMGNVSRMTEEKGHEVLIQAFAEFLKLKSVEADQVHLLLVGGGKLESIYRQLIEELGLQGKVTITGIFPLEDIKKCYACLDIFIFPSLAEGFGIVLIEAMASGLPAICSDLEVLQEVGGATVRYFETGNPKDLAEKMHNLYLKRDNLAELGDSAQNRVEDLYSMEKFVQSYQDLYLRLLEGTG